MKQFLLLFCIALLVFSCQKERTDGLNDPSTQVKGPYFELYGKRWTQVNYNTLSNERSYMANNATSNYYFISTNGSVQYVSQDAHCGNMGPTSGACAGGGTHAIQEPESGSFTLLQTGEKAFFTAQVGEWKGANLKWEILQLDAGNLKIRVAD